jgi:hypothetical protein
MFKFNVGDRAVLRTKTDTREVEILSRHNYRKLRTYTVRFTNHYHALVLEDGLSPLPSPYKITQTRKVRNEVTT